MSEMNRLHAIPWTEVSSRLDHKGRHMIIDNTLEEDSSMEVVDYRMNLNLESTGLDRVALKGVFAAIGHTAQVSLSNQRGYYRDVMKETKIGLNIGYRVAELLIHDISMEDDLLLAKESVRDLMNSQSFKVLLMECIGSHDVDIALALIEESVESWSVQDCLVGR
jgi:hypothetical protein